MSSRALIGGYVIVAGLVAQSAGAQDLRALAARIDSAREKTVVARRELEAYRRGAARETRWTDSVVIGRGRVKVLFNERAAPYARAGIAAAESQLTRLGDFITRLPMMEFSIGPDSLRVPEGSRANDVTSVRFHPTPNTANTTSAERDPDAIAEVIVGKVTEVAVRRAGSDLVTWRKESLPLDDRAWGRTEWGTLRLDVVSSTSFLGRRCHAGDIPSCRIFLGFDSVSDPLTQHYDAAGRRALVHALRQKAPRSSAGASTRCEAGSDSACIAVLRLMDDWERSPSSEYVRRTLLARALAMGGELAPERLLTATGSTGTALSAAARVPLDTLISSWQRDMRERAVASSNLSLPIVISSIISVGICLVLALRSSRWR